MYIDGPMDVIYYGLFGFICCICPVLLICFVVAFIKFTSPKGQAWIRDRDKTIGKAKVDDHVRGFEVIEKETEKRE